MTLCPTCNQLVTDRRAWNQLLVTQEPPEVYWSGVKLPNPSPLQHSILWTLAQRGSASVLALETLSLAESSNSIAASISYLRTWLRTQALPLRVTYKKDHGYRLELT